MSEKRKRRGRLLVAFVQTSKFSVRYEIEDAKATDAQRAMFERIQSAIGDIVAAEREQRHKKKLAELRAAVSTDQPEGTE